MDRGDLVKGEYFFSILEEILTGKTVQKLFGSISHTCLGGIAHLDGKCGQKSKSTLVFFSLEGKLPSGSMIFRFIRIPEFRTQY
jgi:hypothetical protein